MGRVRQTIVETDTFPAFSKSYTQLSQVVRESGLLRRRRAFYLWVGIAIAIGFGGCVTGFILLGESWFQLLIAAALSILVTQVAFLAHEAAHRTIFDSGKKNDRLARILGSGVVGMSYAWWDSKHSRHHSNPNKIDRDPDIKKGVISFTESDASQSRGLINFITQRQGWLFFPLLTLVGLDLHMQGVKYLLSKDKIKGRWFELSLMALRFSILLVPLFLLLPLGMAFAFLGVQLAVFGIYMGASFAPNHKGMPIISPDAKLDFFSKQVRTSRNIRGGWWATWLMGGLNYQIEHHLFPSMPRPHLAKARVIVREYCMTHNVPYTETSLWESYGIVIAYLNRVGLAARDPFECPLTSQYRRV